METFGSGVFCKYLQSVLKYAILVVKVFDFNAWMYYSEYNFHMHVWNGLNWFGLEGVFSGYAERASEADVEANDPSYDYDHYMERDDPKNAILRTAAYFLVGFLGI